VALPSRLDLQSVLHSELPGQWCVRGTARVVHQAVHVGGEGSLAEVDGSRHHIRRRPIDIDGLVVGRTGHIESYRSVSVHDGAGSLVKIIKLLLGHSSSRLDRRYVCILLVVCEHRSVSGFNLVLLSAVVDMQLVVSFLQLAGWTVR